MKKEIAINEILQLGPKCRNHIFVGQLMIVTELKSFGCQGYIMTYNQEDNRFYPAYYRATWEEFEKTGGYLVWEPS